MDKVTEILNEADTLFDLRPVLESIGFDKEVDIFFAFMNKETAKCYETGAIPPSLAERSSALNPDNIYDSVLAFLNKARIQFPELEEALNEALGLPKEGEKEVEIRVISRKGDMVKQEFVLGWPRRCCPCFPGASWCCWC